jgi:deoxycytidylate deaminase
MSSTYWACVASKAPDGRGFEKKDYEDKDLKSADFRVDERRDRNEEGNPLGQQVTLCMHDADLLIVNEDNPMKEDRTAIETVLDGKLRPYISLFEGELRPPNDWESHMSMAYDASLMSECFKRQVGAIVADTAGIVISTGYNQNPVPLKACHLEFGTCYRNIHIRNKIHEMPHCPVCKEALPENLEHPYICPKCKINLYEMLFEDRAMSRCTALHAEEMALLNAGARNVRGCTLYTTTYPCLTCAEKILYAGIKNIVYVESYPDLDSHRLFQSAIGAGRISLEKFEGIKARAYHRLFGPWRKRMEERLMEQKAAQVA